MLSLRWASVLTVLLGHKGCPPSFISFVCCDDQVVQEVVLKALVEAILISTQAGLRKFPILDLHEYPLSMFEL